MTSNNLPNPPPDSNDRSSHQRAFDLVHDVLSHIHPEGSFDLRVTSKDNLTIAIATNSPQFIQERRAVAEEFRTLHALLELGERKPQPGATVEIVISGQSFQLEYSGTESLLELVQLGIDTVQKTYTLVGEEQEQIVEFHKRANMLRAG